VTRARLAHGTGPVAQPRSPTLVMGLTERIDVWLEAHRDDDCINCGDMTGTCDCELDDFDSMAILADLWLESHNRKAGGVR